LKGTEKTSHCFLSSRSCTTLPRQSSLGTPP